MNHLSIKSSSISSFILMNTETTVQHSDIEMQEYSHKYNLIAYFKYRHNDYREKSQ